MSTSSWPGLRNLLTNHELPLYLLVLVVHVDRAGRVAHDPRDLVDQRIKNVRVRAADRHLDRLIPEAAEPERVRQGDAQDGVGDPGGKVIAHVIRDLLRATLALGFRDEQDENARCIARGRAKERRVRGGTGVRVHQADFLVTP